MNISDKLKQKMENMVCIQQFKKALEDKINLREIEISEQTKWDYLYEIYLLFKQLDIPHDTQPTIEQVKHWRMEKMNEYGRKTLAKKIPSINHYFHLVCGQPKNIIPQVKHIKRAKKPVVLSREQIIQMVEFLESKRKYTEAMMIYTCFVTASRRGVLPDIRISDLDFENNIIILRKCKGDIDLKVPMAKKDMEKIKDYLENHRLQTNGKYADYLFIMRNGKKVNYDKLKYTLKYSATKCDIRESVHPHVLRHSRVRDLRRQGYTWEQIMTITGHQDLSSLSSYIHEEDFDTVHNKLNEDTETTKSNTSNDENGMEKELEILKLKLMLEKKEKELLQLQLSMGNYGVKSNNMDTDHKGYV